jgi:hypothetical protein
MSMMNIVQAHELAEELGIPELELQQIARQERLPFSFSMACGYFCQRRDLAEWKAAVERNKPE